MAVRDNTNTGGLKIDAIVRQDTSGYRAYTPYNATVTDGSGKCTISATAGGNDKNPSAIAITIGSKTISARAYEQATLTDIPISKGDKISIIVNGSSNYFTTLTQCSINYS